MAKAFLVTAVMGLSGCATTDGYPMVEGYAIHGVALPGGPVYFGPDPPSDNLIEHEWCHIRRMREYGILPFYSKYFLDDEWACQEERACFFFDPHPKCNGRKN